MAMTEWIGEQQYMLIEEGHQGTPESPVAQMQLII